MTLQDIDKTISDLEKKLDKLQVFYTQYFMGIEKLEPMQQRQVVERLLGQLRRVQIKNTALRFRFQTQVQKFNTLSQYWHRICRQIEEGTYKRDLRRAAKRQQQHGPTPPEENTPVPVVELDDPFDEQNTAKSSDPKLPSPPKPKPPGASPKDSKSRDELEEDLQSFFTRPSVAGAPPTPGKMQADTLLEQKRAAQQHKRQQIAKLEQAKKAAAAAKKRKLTEDRMKKIYSAYVTARQRCNESTDNITYDRIAKTLTNQYDKSGGGVDFKVVIRGGKAAIKAVKKPQ